MSNDENGNENVQSGAGSNGIGIRNIHSSNLRENIFPPISPIPPRD